MGVANPLIVRPDPDGGYEIISGHRRRHAAELAAPSGAGYTPMYQSADAKKERIPTAGFLQRRYPLYEVLLCLMGYR